MARIYGHCERSMPNRYFYNHYTIKSKIVIQILSLMYPSYTLDIANS